jgi:hypothetical protein
VFEDQAFDASAELLQKLSEHIQSGRARLHATTISDQEVTRRMRAWHRQLTAAMDRLPDKNTTKLRPLPGALLADFRSFDLYQSRFRAWLRANTSEIHPINGVDPGPIFQAFFEDLPPFNEEGGKKAEFPDAFSLSALEAWCREYGRPMIIVSRDKGVKAYAAERPTLLESLDLLELMQRLERGRQTSGTEREAFERLVEVLRDEGAAFRAMIRGHLENIRYRTLPGIPAEVFSQNLERQKLTSIAVEVFNYDTGFARIAGEGIAYFSLMVAYPDEAARSHQLSSRRILGDNAEHRECDSQCSFSFTLNTHFWFDNETILGEVSDLHIEIREVEPASIFECTLSDS